jgi:hypothetical protein
MNTLKTLTLTSTVTVALFTAALSANELGEQVRATADQQQSALYQASQQDARAALLKMAIEIRARQSAEQYATEMLALNLVQPVTAKAE